MTSFVSVLKYIANGGSNFSLRCFLSCLVTRYEFLDLNIENRIKWPINHNFSASCSTVFSNFDILNWKFLFISQLEVTELKEINNTLLTTADFELVIRLFGILIL